MNSSAHRFYGRSREPSGCKRTGLNSKYNAKTTPLAEQTKDAASVVSHYRELIRLKTALPALLRGRMEPLDTGSGAIVSYTMQYQDDTVFVAHNLTDAAAEFQLPEPVTSYRLFYASEQGTKQNGDSVIIAPRSSAVFTSGS